MNTSELPVAAPTPSSYRLSPTEIRTDLCQGRQFDKEPDRRWKPMVFRELQCTRKAQDGTDLCKVCTARQARYAENETPKANWLGRITDEPFDWTHMLGTAWAEDRKPKWLGSSVSGPAGSDSGSVAGSDTGSEAPAPVAPPVPVAPPAPVAPPVPVTEVTDARIAALEAENAALKETVAALRAALRAIA